MGTYEWLTLSGIITGPIVAVIITLLVEERRRTREQRTQVLRMLLHTRHLPGDPLYSAAINLIPVEFSSNGKVMAAWHDYIEAVRYQPTEENAPTHYSQVQAKQTTLIYKIMKSMGFGLSEEHIRTSAYAAGGWIERDNLYLDSLRAMREMADAVKLQNG